jgi:hypothetical protein
LEAGDGSRAVVIVVDGDVEVVVGRVLDARPDLAVVDALARLHLAGQRLGITIRLRDVCPELRDLVTLVGLSEILLQHGDD